jgi:hypothetical protein
MVFYTITILICMMVIGVVDYFIVAPIFGIELPFIVVAVTMSTVAEIIIDLILAFFVRYLMPKRWFLVENTAFHAGKKERRFYEKIGIKKWKDSVLELGALSGFRKNKIAKPNDNSYIERYIEEANYGVIVHIACMIGGFAVIFLYPLKFWLCFGFPVAVVNFFLNALPLFILRYNLPKLYALYNFNKRKTVLNKKEQCVNA